MNRGIVVGEVWGTRMCPSLRGRKLVLIDLLVDERSTGEIVVAIDPMEARVGEEVLVTYGSGARSVLAPGPDNVGVLADAAVAEIIDREEPE